MYTRELDKKVGTLLTYPTSKERRTFYTLQIVQYLKILHVTDYIVREERNGISLSTPTH